jgi:hypothetical protein
MFIVAKDVVAFIQSIDTSKTKGSNVVLHLVLMLIFMPRPLLMVKTITRAEFGWWKGTTWFPIVRRTMATHRERASMRMDAQTSWRLKGGVSCCHE